MTSTTYLTRPDGTTGPGAPTSTDRPELELLQDAAADLSWGVVDHPRAGRRAYR